ncbi:hypothetical protein [Armatimonas sp.]|uniref:hypothetical protein n=1 Tax=Armatimonas sp. TaxID=1872638 RepID=UPI0037527DA5
MILPITLSMGIIINQDSYNHVVFSDNPITIKNNQTKSITIKTDPEKSRIPNITYIEIRNYITNLFRLCKFITPDPYSDAKIDFNRFIKNLSESEKISIQKGIPFSNLSEIQKKIFLDGISKQENRSLYTISLLYKIISTLERDSTVLRYWDTGNEHPILFLDGKFGPENNNWHFLLSHKFRFQNSGVSLRQFKDIDNNIQMVGVGLLPLSDMDKQKLEKTIKVLNKLDDNSFEDKLPPPIFQDHTLGTFVSHLKKYSININIDEHLKSKSFFCKDFVFDRDFNQSLTSISEIYGLNIQKKDNTINITDKKLPKNININNLYSEIENLCPSPVKNSINYFIKKNIQKNKKPLSNRELYTATNKSIEEETEILYHEIIAVIRKLLSLQMKESANSTIKFIELDNQSKMLISLLFLINNRDIIDSIQGIKKSKPLIKTDNTSVKIIQINTSNDVQLIDTETEIPRLKFRYVYSN